MSYRNHVITPVALLVFLCTLAVAAFPILDLTLHAGQSSKTSKPPTQKHASAAATAAQQYVLAMAAGDHTAVGRLDFACQYHMTAGPKKPRGYPVDSDPIYGQCWKSISEANDRAVEHRDLGMDAIWPTKGTLAFFGEDLTRYAASAFVMEILGTSPPGGGLQAEVAETTSLPAASFRLPDNGPVVSSPTSLVQLRITYKDPLTSPVTYAPGAYKWTNTVKRPRQALKSIVLKWVVMTGMRKHGFPSDVAVLNLPVTTAQNSGGPPEAIPFVTETSAAMPSTAVWWGPTDAPGLMIAAVARSAHYPNLLDRVALLNRVLLIDPGQVDALTSLSRDLYASILHDSAAAHRFTFSDPVLAMRFSELYWDTYAQTTRMDIALGMEMGGLPAPTTADSLYRMIPAMEKLAEVRPQDTENRLRLGIAYRWNNDQLVAIKTHETLLNETPKERGAFRARILDQLAWSRIARIAWNRTFDDPVILDAYRAAEEALTLADSPVEKFVASYTMAYSLAFTPHRDNPKMVELLTEARRWFLQIGGSSADSWRYLLANDTLKGIVETDPAFGALLAAS
jgi:hypothetical protein